MQIYPLSSVKGSLFLRSDNSNPLIKTSWVEILSDGACTDRSDLKHDETFRQRMRALKRQTAVPPPREKVPWTYYRPTRFYEDDCPMDEYEEYSQSQSQSASSFQPDDDSAPDDECSANENRNVEQHQLVSPEPVDPLNSVVEVEGGSHAQRREQEGDFMMEEPVVEEEPMELPYEAYERTASCVVERQPLSFGNASQFLTEGLVFKTTDAPKKIIRPQSEEKVQTDKIGILPPTLAAMIHAAARELRPVPKEHKVKYKPVATCAAEIGQFIRLEEDIIEAVSVGKADKERIQYEESWAARRTSLVLMANARSEAFRCVHEAATLGRMTALTPKIIANYTIESDEEEWEEDLEDIDEILDENGHKPFRTDHLMNYHIHDVEKSKIRIRDWAPQKYLQMQSECKSIEDVKLPTPKLPTFKKSTKKLTREEFREALSTAVAEISWDRRYRLERPNAPMKVTLGCKCKYCERPNIFQTALYRKKHNELVERRGRLQRTPSLPSNQPRTPSCSPSMRHMPRKTATGQRQSPRITAIKKPPPRTTSFQMRRKRDSSKQPQRSYTLKPVSAAAY